MYRTYLIQNKKGDILQMFSYLSHAKYDLVKLFNTNTCTILALKGQYFGEGYHFYRLAYNKKTKAFKKVPIKLEHCL